MSRTIIDLGALGPDWQWQQAIEHYLSLNPLYLRRMPPPPPPSYWTTCPASISALPIVDGLVRPPA